MARPILSAFADEYRTDFDGQMEGLKSFGINFTELRFVNGENISTLTDTQLGEVKKKLSENGIDHVICCHPLLGESTIQHLIIPEINLSIVSKDGIFPVDIPEEQIVRKITLQAMLDKDYMNSHKNKLAFIKRLLRETVNLAIENLQNAREIHLKIEQEYAKGSDFSRIKDIKEKLMTKLFTTT